MSGEIGCILPILSRFRAAPVRWLRQARRELVSAFEKEYLRSLLEESRGRVGVTATRAGITPRSLFEKLQRYGLRKETFRGTAARRDGEIDAPLG